MFFFVLYHSQFNIFLIQNTLFKEITLSTEELFHYIVRVDALNYYLNYQNKDYFDSKIAGS